MSLLCEDRVLVSCLMMERIFMNNIIIQDDLVSSKDRLTEKDKEKLKELFKELSACKDFAKKLHIIRIG